LDDQHVNLMRELIRAEERGDKPKGELTLKVTYTLDGGMLDVQSDVKVSKPRLKRPRTVLFADPTGKIVGEPPRQLSMFGGTAETNPPISTAAPVGASEPVSVAPQPAFASSPVANVDARPMPDAHSVMPDVAAPAVAPSTIPAPQAPEPVGTGAPPKLQVMG
jgi:hypothetical protein